jgi:outer membrane protein TolC
MLALLCGCATYQPAPIDPATSADQFRARRLDAPEIRDRIDALVPRSGDAPPRWDRARLLAAALILNPSLSVARAEVEAALAREAGAGRPENPQLTLQTEYARHDPHPWLYGVGIDLALGGKRRALEAELARIETGSARYQLMERTWDVRRALTAALSAREDAHRRAELLARVAAAQQRLVEIERRRLAAGESAADLLQVATQAQRASEQEAAQVRADAVAAQAALAAALGVVPAALDGIAVDWPDWGYPPEPPADALAKAREQALHARADLADALQSYAAAENRLHQAVLRQFPQFHLAPGYYWDHGVGKFPLDIGFDLPLPGHADAEIAAARAARDLAGKRLLAVQATIIGAIEAAQRTERAARDNVEAAMRSLEALRMQSVQAATRVRLGASAADEALVADIAALRGEADLLRLRAQWQAARDALEDALHAPLSGAELQLAPALRDATAETIR